VGRLDHTAGTKKTTLPVIRPRKKIWKVSCSTRLKEAYRAYYYSWMLFMHKVVPKSETTTCDTTIREE
jgi:hypothetical protein